MQRIFKRRRCDSVSTITGEIANVSLEDKIGARLAGAESNKLDRLDVIAKQLDEVVRIQASIKKDINGIKRDNRELLGPQGRRQNHIIRQLNQVIGQTAESRYKDPIYDTPRNTYKLKRSTTLRQARQRSSEKFLPPPPKPCTCSSPPPDSKFFAGFPCSMKGKI